MQAVWFRQCCWRVDCFCFPRLAHWFTTAELFLADFYFPIFWEFRLLPTELSPEPSSVFFSSMLLARRESAPGIGPRLIPKMRHSANGLSFPSHSCLEFRWSALMTGSCAISLLGALAISAV